VSCEGGIQKELKSGKLGTPAVPKFANACPAMAMKSHRNRMILLLPAIASVKVEAALFTSL
jgi:hypothetical protein